MSPFQDYIKQYNNQGNNIQGVLKHSKHIQYIPYVNHLVFQNEADIFEKKIKENQLPKIQNILVDEQRYELFLKQKARRPIFDIYACFQPFNEASKALFPFLKQLKKIVKKDDLILNLWDRSGWRTSLLAGLFPEQQIITTWEGNKDVLGYKGYHFWFKEQKNVKVLFCDLNAPLPFLDNTIAFSIGFDAFHRFNQQVLLHELMRVVRPDGAIIFPHVHLTNSEPEPYFDRGCKQMHGKDYAAVFNTIEAKTDWKGYVFSEPSLFLANDVERKEQIPLVSTPNTNDYNALLALLPKSWDSEVLTKFDITNIESIEQAFIIVNLLFKIDLHQQKITIDDHHKDGSVKHLLDRHPVYVEYIKSADGFELSSRVCQILYLAQKAYTIQEISDKLTISIQAIVEAIIPLEKRGVLQVLPVSRAGMRLQQYLMSQDYIVPKEEQTLQKLWNNAVELFPEQVAIKSLADESVFAYEDCAEIVTMVANRLQAMGLKKGDKVISCSRVHTESIFLFWACMDLGLVFVPVAAHLPTKILEHIINTIKAKVCFVSLKVFKEKANNLSDIDIVVYDEEEEIKGNYFADWLEEQEGTYSNVEVWHNDPAVILFTSGSTGIPKGVQLAHGNLYRSGRLITETFHWTSKDAFFALGGLEIMSGLRNSAIAPLHIGASVVIPSEMAVSSVFGVAEAIEESQATILGSNPAMLRQLVKFEYRVKRQLQSIKKVICTGNNLTQELRKTFKDIFGHSICNYYGLTETTGICLSESPLDDTSKLGTIGQPIACIAQIVDEHKSVVPIGTEGELRIFSENIMQGYYQQKILSESVIQDSWFYTGDIAKYTAEGRVLLMGRKKQILKTANEEIIYIKEIENFIRTIEGIEDVTIQQYNEEDIEKMIAYIVLKTSPTEEHKVKIKKAIEEQLGTKKIPNIINFQSSLPYSDSGKLLINELPNA